MTHIRPTHTHLSDDVPRQTSRRIKVTLPATVAQKLDRLAMRVGEPAAKVAAQMIRQAITDAERDEPARNRRARETRAERTRRPGRTKRVCPVA